MTMTMTKEKKTFAWDTVLNMSLATDGKLTVAGTNIEVVWCPVTKMYWEKYHRDMLTLCATGKSSLDDVTPMYLWSYGDYRYEIEVKSIFTFGDSEAFESSYEDALNKFENMVVKVSLV